MLDYIYIFVQETQASLVPSLPPPILFFLPSYFLSSSHILSWCKRLSV